MTPLHLSNVEGIEKAVAVIWFCVYLFRARLASDKGRNLVVPELVKNNSLAFFAHGLGSWTRSAFEWTERDFIWENTKNHETLVSRRGKKRGLPLFHDMISVQTAFDRTWDPMDINIGELKDGDLYANAVAGYCRTDDARGRPLSKHIVLVGHSRGGSTVLNALALLSKYPEWETVIRPRIAFVLVMGVFATVSDVLTFRHGFLGSRVHSILVKFTGVSQVEHWSPLNIMPTLPRNVPIGIVASRIDVSVPFSSTFALYEAFCKEGLKIEDPLLLESTTHHFQFASEERHMITRYVHDLCAKHIEEPLNY